MKQKIKSKKAFLDAWHSLLATLTLASLILSQSICHSATYYCDPVNGNTTTGDGSAANPWGTLQSVVEAGYFSQNPISSGDTVKLKTGFHGQFYIDKWIQGWQHLNTDYVHIEADDGAVPDLNRVHIQYSPYWHLKGLRISSQFSEWDYPKNTYMVDLYGGNHRIIVEDCNIFSIEDASSWDANDWRDLAYPAIRGGASDSIFRNNIIRNVSNGITTYDRNVLIENNTIDGFCVDAMHVNGPNNTVQDNIITNVYDDNEPDTHTDAIQVIYGQSPDNLIIRRNYVCVRTDPNRGVPAIFDPQGFYLNGVITNALIENNVVMSHNGVWGIALGNGSDNVKIMNNTVIHPYGLTRKPDIVVGDSTNIIVRNNIADAFPASDPSKNIVVDHNFDVDNYDPLVEFVDYPNGNVHLAAGSSFIDAGSTLDAPKEDLDGGVRPYGTGYDIGAYEYGAVPLKGDLNKDGKVNIQDVQCCVNHMLGKQDWGSAADVNKDGIVNKLDIEEIINIILEGK